MGVGGGGCYSLLGRLVDLGTRYFFLLHDSGTLAFSRPEQAANQNAANIMTKFLINVKDEIENVYNEIGFRRRN